MGKRGQCTFTNWIKTWRTGLQIFYELYINSPRKVTGVESSNIASQEGFVSAEIERKYTISKTGGLEVTREYVSRRLSNETSSNGKSPKNPHK